MGPAGSQDAVVVGLPSTRPAVHPQVPPRQAWSRGDVWALLIVAIATMLYAGAIHASLDSRFLSAPIGNDVWFEADMPVVAYGMVSRWASHSRNTHHPLFPLWTTAPSYALSALRLTPRQRVLLLVAFAASVWGAAVFLLLRFATQTRVDALVFTLLACATAAALFWLPTAETYVLGSATLLAPLILVTGDSRGRMRDHWYVAASALSLSVTTTNWMAGIAAAFSSRPVRAAIQITANALAIVVTLWAVQKWLVPTAPFFIGGDPGSRFFWSDIAGGPAAMTRSLVFHSIVMPDVQVVLEPKWGPRLSVQAARLGSSGVFGAAATVLWTALFSAGIVSLLGGKTHRSLYAAMLSTLIGQLVLYNCYGEESFLYALHVAPLLVACAAVATTTRYRRWVLLATGVLILLLLINNLQALVHALQFFSAGGRSSADAL